MKKTLISTIIPVLLLVCQALAAPLEGQSIRAQAKLDTTRILIGDQVNLWLTVEQPEGLRLEAPQIGDSLAGKLEVMSVSSMDTISRQNRFLTMRQRILVTSFDTGFFVIPPFVYRFNDRKDSILTRALPLEVFAMPVDTTKGITDIKPPYEMKVGFGEILPWLLAGLVMLAAILVGYWYYLRRRNKPVIADKPAPPPVPAHILALEELDQLVREKLWQQGKIKLYYSRLTDIIRQYIERRFGVPAMEQTTEDIIRDFSRQGLIREGIRQELKTLLELADLVKFAKWNPVADEHEASQQSAYDFILRTKPVINLRKPAGEEVVEIEKEEGA